MARLAGAKVGRKIGLTAGAVAGRKAGAKACILAVDNAIQEVSRDKVAALRVLFAEIAFKAGKFQTLFMKKHFLSPKLVDLYFKTSDSNVSQQYYLIIFPKFCYLQICQNCLLAP